MKKLKILITNPVDRVSKGSINIDPVITRHTGAKTKIGAYFPLGLAGIYSLLSKEEEFDVNLYDPIVQGNSYEFILNKCLEADVVVCPLSTLYAKDTFYLYEQLIGKTRIFIGTISSVHYKEILSKGVCEIICLGEPEYTLLDICRVIHRNLSLSKVPGIAYREGLDVIVNEQRELINELDDLPFPNRTILDNSKYTNQTFIGESVAIILTSRGCPFSCVYCATHAIYGNRWRARSAENVIAELSDIYFDIGIKNVIIMDDTFTIDRNRVIKICDLICEKKIKINFVCLSRVDAINENILNSLKKAGCVEIRLGVESGSQKILDSIKKNITIEKIIQASQLVKKSGIAQSLFFMIGNPGETKDTIEQTISLAMKLDPEFASFNITTPFPGSELYDRKRLNFDEISLLETENSTISVCDLTPEYLNYELRRCYRTFYFRPKYFILFFKKIANRPRMIPVLINVYFRKFIQLIGISF